MEDILRQLANEELVIRYHSAEQGRYLDELLRASKLGVDFNSANDIDEDTAEKFPFYYVFGRWPRVDWNGEEICRLLGPKAKIVDFDRFIEVLHGATDDEEINADISDII